MSSMPTARRSTCTPQSGAIALRRVPTPTGFSEIWRSKQLEYTSTLTPAGCYIDFWTLTERALDYAFARMPSVNRALRPQLLEAYLKLDAFPDARPPLRRRTAHGLPSYRTAPRRAGRVFQRNRRSCRDADNIAIPTRRGGRGGVRSEGQSPAPKYRTELLPQTRTPGLTRNLTILAHSLSGEFCVPPAELAGRFETRIAPMVTLGAGDAGLVVGVAAG
jgi:hypothetical protein